MKLLLAALSLFLAIVTVVPDEAKQYTGTLSSRKVSGTLSWIGEKNVSGVIAAADAPDRQLTLTGTNVSSGKIKLTLSEGASLVGTVSLTKVTSAGSIIWSGTVKFADGSTGVLELQRPR